MQSLILQIGFVQWGGYGLAVVGQLIGKQYIAKKAVRIVLLICAFGLLVMGIFPSSKEIPSPALPPSYGPLSTYLRSHGVYPDQTIYVTMASKGYIESAINFKRQLDKFSLGGRFIVLCVDLECVEVMSNHSILGYDGYLQTESEAQDDWHLPIARMKVTTPLPFFFENEFLINLLVFSQS